TLEKRKSVAEQAKNCCEYCRSQEKFAMQSFSVEHIIPRSKGGKTVKNNLAYACQGCNAHKYNKTEEYDSVTGKISSLFNPRRQRWVDHFKWSDDFSLIIGMTPIGRVTIETLKFNRDGLVNLRKILYSTGDHPPDEEIAL
ncbi:MAG: HNH endonuclease, partial [Thermodesulfobacteriota bacterium]|nr:HNH endonuclease [Thermodesulfobacteriota bacterium]